jgi:hypothetical protein
VANLDPMADKAVHDAVDAFMEGRLAPLAGDTAFETKNSRYRVLDGTVVAAPDPSLIGAELVGWLMEQPQWSSVEPMWQPGARAVLIDRYRGRNIIVTSTTRLLPPEIPPAPDPPAPPLHAPTPYALPAPYAPPPSYAPPPYTPPPPAPAVPPPRFSAQRAPIVASTPPPATAIHSAAAVQRRAAAIHLPPRPIPSSSANVRESLGLPQPRPLPAPAPPPRRDPLPPFAHQVNGPEVPADDSAWEVTSAEYELSSDASYDDAAQREETSVDGPESSRDAPIPLVRPIDPHDPGGRSRR